MPAINSTLDPQDMDARSVASQSDRSDVARPSKDVHTTTIVMSKRSTVEPQFTEET
jgi:hypothetical protein